MFTPYFGEFLVSPFPVQLTLNRCSHGCAFCFTQKTAERELNAQAASNFLANYQDRETLVAQLVKRKYPVLVSNLTDPFAQSNYRQTLPILRTMTDVGIPIAIQTRGGEGIDEALTFMEPSHWYISIPYLNDDVRRKIEPAAPSLDHRFELIDKVRAKGHRVSVGINPLVPEWLSVGEAELLIKRLASSGVEGAWLAMLHFDNKLVAEMSQRNIEAVGQKLINRGRYKTMQGPESEHYDTVVKLLDAYKLSHYEGPVAKYSTYFKSARELYPRLFPVLQDFINWCFKTRPEHPISFDEFRAALIGDMPEGTWITRDYIRVISNINVGEDDRIPRNLSFENLLRVFWSEYSFKRSLITLDCFALWVDGDAVVRDDYGMPYYWFDPAGFKGVHAEADLSSLTVDRE